MQTLRVFCDKQGNFGNPVGIVVDTERQVNKDQRLKITVDSGFSEVVFVNSIKNKEVSIYCPQNEISFAGHAVLGAAYFLSKELGLPITQLTSMGGLIETWREGELIWVRGNLSILPNWNYKQLNDVESIEKLTISETLNKEHTFVWAWIDERKSIIRARTFASDWGIPEDEANGSGAMKLALILNQQITIIHGKGSIIHARPSINNTAEAGGLVI